MQKLFVGCSNSDCEMNLLRIGQAKYTWFTKESLLLLVSYFNDLNLNYMKIKLLLNYLVAALLTVTGYQKLADYFLNDEVQSGLPKLIMMKINSKEIIKKGA